MNKWKCLSYAVRHTYRDGTCVRILPTLHFAVRRNRLACFSSCGCYSSFIVSTLQNVSWEITGFTVLWCVPKCLAAMLLTTKHSGPVHSGKYLADPSSGHRSSAWRFASGTRLYASGDLLICLLLLATYRYFWKHDKINTSCCRRYLPSYRYFQCLYLLHLGIWGRNAADVLRVCPESEQSQPSLSIYHYIIFPLSSLDILNLVLFKRKAI